MKKYADSNFTDQEHQQLAQLKTPWKIQEFLDSIPYSIESRYRCPRSVLRDHKAHCYDVAVLAAATLQIIGYKPLLVEIIPNRHDDDHILAVFRNKTRWGAVAKSNFVGLRYREPVYRDLRELIMSYFESYFNVDRERTMVGYTLQLNLNRFNALDWCTNDWAMDIIANALDLIRRYQVISPALARKLNHVDARSYKAGLMDANPSGLYKP